MNSSRFMDKQVTGLPGARNDDLIDLLNPQEEQRRKDIRKKDCHEDILPNLDFAPIRSQSINLEGNSNVVGTRVSNSADFRGKSSDLRTYGSLDTIESTKVVREKDNAAYYSAMVSEIDLTMKKHADKLLDVFDGLGAQLTQLESRTRNLESLVDDLKVSAANTHGKTDGKLRQLENILREVQTGVQFLRDKQDITEAQLQLANLQASKVEQQSDQKNTAKADSAHAFSAQQSHQSVAPLDVPQPPQQLPPLPPHNAPHSSFQQVPTPVQPSIQQPQSHGPSISPIEPYRGQLPEGTHMQYQLPPAQQPQVPSLAPLQQLQPAPQPSQYSQPPQQHPPVAPINPSPQLQPPLSHRHEETLYVPPQSYPPSVRQSPSMTQPPTMPPLSPQYYGASSHMYESPSDRTDTGFSSGYGPPSGPNFADLYPYSGSHSLYGGSTMKPPQLSSSSASGGGSSYKRIPTAQMLPHALSTSHSEGGVSSSGGGGNEVPIDDIVDKVATMGFSREQVRTAVRKLSESGQSVDLNIVLDKLMNDADVQPQKGWYGR